jgi:acetyl esterase/lipase
MKVTGGMIHPQLRPAGLVLRALVPDFGQTSFRLYNSALALMKNRRVKGMRREQVFLPRPEGSAAEGRLRLCVYSPFEARENAPGILWMHGGGYAFGIPEQDEGFIRNFVAKRGCVVIAPDYCLSAQAPYPAALEDCYAALLWLRDHAASLHVRPDQLMVGGNSAGGGLAAALAIRARDRGEAAIAWQMPLYPMLDDRILTASMRGNDAPIWNARSSENAWKLYLGALYGTEDVPPCAAPARLESFSGLPPAFTFVGSIEPFCDETVSYMEKLKAAGVAAECHVFEGCYHGFDVVAPWSAPARRARELLMASFDRAASSCFARQPQAGQ